MSVLSFLLPFSVLMSLMVFPSLRNSYGEKTILFPDHGAVWAFATAYWFFPKIGGKTFFRGPITSDASFSHEFPFVESVDDDTKKGGNRANQDEGTVSRVRSIEL
ncbi:uncharacterized protein IL334_001838 [Kwoniella shivajii]|uniref:Uncharacterized protein n=1 Tax=Kwoniella shivajii TaxID=564305 RepID=A0ABZ1CT13_9TREE|nr:hypothetical protein IL334_001838 [Kwoniella shivajii]